MLGGIEDSDKDFFRKHGKLSFVDVVKLLNYAKNQAIEATLEVAAARVKYNHYNAREVCENPKGYDPRDVSQAHNEIKFCDNDVISILSLISSEYLKVE